MCFTYWKQMLRGRLLASFPVDTAVRLRVKSIRVGPVNSRAPGVGVPGPLPVSSGTGTLLFRPQKSPSCFIGTVLLGVSSRHK
jgi:hypothetical protein